MARIKMVVTDLDGTYFYRGNPLPENLEAVRKARAQGVKVFACTARGWAMCSYLLAHSGLDEWGVTSNGAAVVHIPTGKVNEPCYLESRHVESIIQAVARCGKYGINTNCGEIMYTCPEYLPWWLPEAKEHEKNLPYEQQIRFEICRNLQEMIDKSRSACELIRIETGREQIPLPKEIETELGKIDQFDVTTSFSGHWDVNHKNATKENGMMYLAQRFGFAREEVMAIGDDINDTGMIQTAGVGVAMGNAELSVRKQADDVTDLCSNGGFAKALEKWVLK